jgi:predicted HTH domain antitoxin
MPKFSLRNLALFFLFTIILAPIPAVGQRIHPRLKKPKSEKSEITRMVIMPVEVSLNKDGMKGGEPMEKEAAAAVPYFEKAITTALTSKNLKVLENPFKKEVLEENEKLKYAVADLVRDYKQLVVLISKKNKDVEKGRFTLGDKVLLLNQDDEIDAFVFINAFGTKKSGGKKALGIITLNPFMIVPTYAVFITIADARSGDILAYNQMMTFSDITKEDGKSLTELLKKALKKVPNGESPQPASELPKSDQK